MRPAPSSIDSDSRACPGHMWPGPVDPPRARKLGGLVGFRRVAPANGRAGAVNSPSPPRDGSAASHLGGRIRLFASRTTSSLP